MKPVYRISPEPLTIEQMDKIVKGHATLGLSPTSKKLIKHCRSYLDHKLDNSDALFYGINTGFGALCNVRISKKEIAKLQENLVLSHAAGMGEAVAPEIVKLMLFLKIHALAMGHSGVSLELEEALINLYNHDLIPVVYQQGSLGASGDLAPLAHMSLPLIGKGEVYASGRKQKSRQALKRCNLVPVKLQVKEGLALLNGTQFMTAYGLWCLLKTGRMIRQAEVIAALSIEGFEVKAESFLPFTHRLRPHPGQVTTAAHLLKLLKGSEMSERPKAQVQDPYSFRCIPQVHGAIRDTYDFVKGVMETELNAVTDNPILFPEEDLILSGGNFHGQPLALAMDYLAIALAELGSISERRTYLLLSGQRGLPPFLAAHQAGLHSGLMIAQYTAAAIVSENKGYCTPASVDSITSSNGQEDHVSMGAGAATKLCRVLSNVETILAIELLCAMQALAFRRPLKTSDTLERVVEAYRKEIPFRSKDREIHPDIEKSILFIRKQSAS